MRGAQDRVRNGEEGHVTCPDGPFSWPRVYAVHKGRDELPNVEETFSYVYLAHLETNKQTCN
jgi:hypothetical protein